MELALFQQNALDNQKSHANHIKKKREGIFDCVK